MPAFPSDLRSGVQPDTAPRLYCHRHHRAAAWNHLPGGCVGTARQRGGPCCSHRGSNGSGPAPVPWLSASIALSDPHAFRCRPLLLPRTPASPFRFPLPPPSETLLPLQFQLSPLKPSPYSDSSASLLRLPQPLPSNIHHFNPQTPILFCWTQISSEIYTFSSIRPAHCFLKPPPPHSSTGPIHHLLYQIPVSC